jgi:hypothetical protein
MAKKSTSIRIFTKRYDDKKSYEYIEIDSFGIIWWGAEDYISFALIYDSVGAKFPVDIDFVRDKFEEDNRILDETKLPENVVKYPYQMCV